MDIELLREFLVVADELSLTHAAKRLHTTQSTLSKHLAVLEREFGASLLRRARHGVELTPEGAVLYRRASIIVDNFDGAIAELREMRVKPAIKVSGMLQNTEIMTLLSHVARMLQEQEEPRTTFTPVFEVPFIEKLHAKAADVTICHRSEEADADPSLRSIALFDEPFFALLEKDNPLAHLDSLSVSDLEDVRLMHLVSDYGQFGWEAIRQACRTDGFEPKSVPVVVRSPIDFMTAPLHGSVLILQKGFMAGSFALDDRFRVVKVSGEGALFTLKAYYRAADAEAVKPLLEALAQGAAAMRGQEEQAPRLAARAPFRARCDELAERCGLNESERNAMASFAKGRSIDRISQEIGLSRMMTGDLLASVYRKVGVTDRQDLIDAIEAIEVKS